MLMSATPDLVPDTLPRYHAGEVDMIIQSPDSRRGSEKKWVHDQLQTCHSQTASHLDRFRASRILRHQYIVYPIRAIDPGCFFWS